MHIRVCAGLDAAPTEVWSLLEPIERHVDWMADAVAITFVGEQRRGLGTTFDCRTRVGPLRTTDRMTVTEWDPPRAMGIAHRGAVTGRGRFTLRDRSDGRTWFCWEETLIFPWWMGGRIGALAARPVLRALWRRNLRRLAALVEASARGA